MSARPPIIAILGLPGSGKTEAVHYVMEKYHLPKVYFGEITLNEVKARGLPLTPENERIVREDLRVLHGEDYHAKKIIQEIDALGGATSILVESLYSWVEYRILKDHYREAFFTIAVYAPPRIRYERLAHRALRPLTREEAVLRDYSQIERLHQGGPIAIADYMVMNESTLEELQNAVGKIVSEITKSN